MVKGEYLNPSRLGLYEISMVNHTVKPDGVAVPK